MFRQLRPKRFEEQMKNHIEADSFTLLVMLPCGRARSPHGRAADGFFAKSPLKQSKQVEKKNGRLSKIVTATRAGIVSYI
jgi:hypothetical protein